jgi:multidrug efflux pump
MRLIDAALGRTRTILLSLAVILIAGASIYGSIPKEAQPDIEIPVIYVRMHHEGISPEDAERLLVRPMEQELRSLEGVKELSGEAYEGGASVTVEFYAGIDTDQAMQDVREKVDLAKAELPEDTEEPRVNEVKFSKMDPMLVINISGEIQERTLIRLARDLKDDIESIAGVLEVDMRGDREEVLEVVVDPLAMESYGLKQEDLYNLVARNNRLVAAGSLDAGKGRFAVKVPGVFEDPEDVLNLPVKVDGTRVVRFRDIASARRTFKDPESYARINGHTAIGLEVAKRAGANIIATVDRIKDIIAEREKAWPRGVTVTISRDKSDEVRDRLTDLQNNVLSAVLLVFLVIIGFLGFRSAMLVGIAIPGSFLMAILALGLAGVTVNMVVLFALIMAVGMLVDGAIVVTELADRKMAEGHHRKEAYALASKRMAWPIIASTVTTLAAFFPLLFWPGIAGQFMRYMPITIIATLSASLLMALIFVPTLGAFFGKQGAINPEAARQLSLAEGGNLEDVSGWTGRYLRLLASSLRHPLISVALVTFALICIFAAYGKFGRGVEFFPDTEPEFITFTVKARGDLSIDEQDDLVQEVESRIIGLDGVKSVYARSGKGSREAEDVIGSIKLELEDWRSRPRADEIIADVRSGTSDLVGIVIESFKPRVGPPRDKAISLELASIDPAALERATVTVRKAFESIEGLRDVTDTRPLPGIEWRIDVDREQAAKFGADITIVGNTVQLVTNGVKIGEYRPDDTDDEIDIRVRYPMPDRSLDQIGALRVSTTQGSVPISNFVIREPAPKVSTLQRTDLRRTMKVEADVDPGVLAANKIVEIGELLPQLDIDPIVKAQFKGEDRDLREAMDFLKKAFIAALAIIAIILVTQFNSIYQAMLILTAVLFSTGGVLLGLLFADMAFGVVMSGVGVIALAGVVVNNNIVLIDTYNNLLAQGQRGTEAILRTCAQRLRPVMLTTVTTILGLMPMVLEMNIDFINRDVSIGGPSAQLWRQLASAVAGGLAFATVLTLILTPSLLKIQQNVAARWHRRTIRKDESDSPGLAAG